MLIYDPRKIIALRQERGMNQSQLARKAKLSAPAIWYLEEGKTKMPKYDTLIRIAAALGVPVALIMADQQAPDIDSQIAAAVANLPTVHKAALLAAAVALAEAGKKPRKK